MELPEVLSATIRVGATQLAMMGDQSQRKRREGNNKNPVRLILTADQVADVTQGAALIEAIPTDAVIADKGYDSDALIDLIEAAGAEAIIPPRSNRNTQRTVDWHRYKARNLVERFFNRLKQFRRIATRYDKLAKRFNAFLHLACAYIWLL